jgi:hypothetical protein
MGVVYKARDRSLERIVALKMILTGPLATAEDIQRFAVEAKAAAILDHPNIVPVYEIGQLENQHYFTMAFIEGDSLSGLIRNKGLVLSFPEAALTIQVMADAIQYAHDHGIIHRDLKPENVLVDKLGRPRITDFGLAKRLEVDCCMTATGQIMGTPSYMAPEQAQGKPVTASADVYALGAILYFLLTRRPPFVGKTLMETLVQVSEKEPIPPRELNPSVAWPPELEAICLKCLRKDPAERFATAGELAAALQAWVNHASPGLSTNQPLAARLKPGTLLEERIQPLVAATIPMTIPTPPQRQRSLRPWVIGVAVVACVVGIGVAVALWSGLGGSGNVGPDKDGTVVSTPPPEPAPQVLAPKDGHDAWPPAPVRHTRVIQVKQFTRPEKLRQDFAFKVTLNGGTAGPNGEYSLAHGKSTVTFTVETERDAYVRIWAIDGADGQVLRLFPNDYEPDVPLRAGKVHTIPGRNSYGFDTEPSQAVEHYWVMASTQPWKKLKGQAMGAFEAFSSTEDQKAWEQELTRAIAVERKTLVGQVTELAEEIFPYRVRKEN